MVKPLVVRAPLLSLFFLVAACHPSASETSATESTNVVEQAPLTAEQQAALTPDAVIESLERGNREFVDDELTVRNTSGRVRRAAEGQFPKAVILSCLDSRVPVEDVFHRGLGDLFVARVAGNVVNDDILGSMEFGCQVAGAKVIVVLGHEHCGAVKSAIEDVHLGHVTQLLAKIRSALNVDLPFDGARSSLNPAFVRHITEQNVRLNVQRIRDESPILRQMEQEHRIKIVGAMYDMDSGRVRFYE